LNQAVAEDFVGQGEMGALMRSMDWSQTLLGSVAGWCQSLRTTVNILLNSPSPMFVVWGSEYAVLYNDACCTVLGLECRAHSLGQSAKDWWAEWTRIEAYVDRVFSQGESCQSEPLSFQIHQHGRVETVNLIFSFTPLNAADGSVGGGFCVVTPVISTTEHNRIQAELQTSKERLQMAIQAARMVAWTWDASTGIITRSATACDILGLPPDALLGSGEEGWNLVHPEDRANHQARVAAAIAAKGSYVSEFRMVRPDNGSVIWVEDRGKVTCDAMGNLTSLEGLLSDITHRKLAEETLQKREAQLRLVTNAIPALISYIDSQLCYRFNNRAYEEWFGHSALEVYGKPLREVLGEQAYETLIPYFEQVLAGQQVSFESQVPYRKGGIRHVQATYIPHINQQGNVEGFIALVNDISDRRQTELEREQILDREQQRVRQLYGLTEAALTINAVLSIKEVLQIITNQAAAIVGAHQAVTSMKVNEDWSEAIHTMYLSDKYAQWRQYEEDPDGSGIYTYVCEINQPLRMTQAELEAHTRWRGFGKAADRHPPMRGWLAAPLTGQDGRNIGLIQLSDKFEGEFTQEDEAILVQLAQMASVAVENARLYKAEQDARTQAEATNRIKDEFLAILSHELRSPLNPILGWAKLLRSRQFDPTTRSNALETIERNAKLQAQLIEDLLDVSRILQGKMVLNMTSVNLVSVIESALETVHLAAEAKGIQIQKVINIRDERVVGDANRLQQIVWNLLSNAIKFTPAGGRVEVRLDQVGQDVQIQVSDSGKGITVEFLPHVFEYFRQEDGRTTRQFGGLGLGLAIVRHLTESHGGTVHADSPGEGLGSVFTISLPLAKQTEADTPKSSSLISRTSLAHLRILVVDDEIDMRELAQAILEQCGAEVKVAASAMEALTALAQFKPDVLISDIGMPDVDGYTLMHQVRHLATQRTEGRDDGSPIAIALTAYAGELNQQKALAAGFQKHLAKPIDPDELVESIIRLLE
jgi:PAS domain S-box-containing protein